MLVRKENEIEIWNDTMKKGTGKRTIIVGIGAIIFFPIIMMLAGTDFSIIETYYILGFLSLPGIAIIVSGLIFMKRENNEYLIARVNSNFVELYAKRSTKQINISQITKINKISSSLGSFLVLFYNNNGNEFKFSFEINSANKNLLVIAIKEYNKNVVVKEH